MVQYLLDRYGQGLLQPEPGTPSMRCIPMSWFAEATFARPLGEIVNHLREFPGELTNEAALEEMRNRGRLCIEALVPELSQRDYIAGENFGPPTSCWVTASC